jgi:TRAP-type C4-dicarboxylate transport system substrate-binding protein
MQSVQGVPRSDRLSRARPGARTMRRRALLAAGAALAIPFLPRYAQAAEVTWRIGHNAPADFPMHVRLVEAAAAVADRSEGQMAVEIHPNSELGSPVGLFTQLRAGTIDAALLSCQLLANNLAVTALPTVGFAFAGYDRLWPALDGDVGRYVRAQMTERLGLVAMDSCWDFGFRQITTSGKPVNTAANMEGLRLRTPPEADFIGLFQSLKALPVTMPLNALNNALSTHSIDGQESVLPLVKAAGLFRVQSVCALTNHVWDGQWLCVSGKAWSTLPAKLKDVVAPCLNESALLQRQDTADGEAKIRKDLEAAGMVFNAPDPRSFRSVLRKSGYYAAWNKKMGDDGWAALEKYSGRLT